MRIIVQRSKESNVKINNEIHGKIDKGYVLLVSFTYGDNKEIIDKMITKLLNLRIFEDENGKMNNNLSSVNGEILSISQFTLYASLKGGNRPSFTNSLNYEEASILYDYFNETLKKHNIKVETGIFGADMEVNIKNNGPVTIIMDSQEIL